MRVLLFISFLLFSSLLFSQRPDLVVSTGHASQINTIDMSVDGVWIASGGTDNLVKIIHTRTGKELRTLSDNNGRVEFLKFDNSGKYIGAGLNHGSIKVWNIESGAVIFEFPANSATMEFDYCLKNEKIVYLDDNGSITTIDYKTGSDKKTFENIGLQRIKGHPSGKSVFGYDYKSKFFEIDLATGEKLQEVELFKEFKYSPCRMDIDNKGEFLAVAFDGKENGKNGEVHILKVKDLSRVGILKGHTSRIFDLKFDEKTQTLITTGHDGMTKLWDISKMKEITSLNINTFSSFALEAHPKEKIFLIAENNQIHYINQKTGRIIKTFKSKGNKIVNLAYDQVGKYMAASTLDLQIKIWDLEQNKVIRTVMGLWPVAFSPNGEDLVSMGMGINLTVWNPMTGKSRYNLDTEGELIQNISFSVDGKKISGAGFLGVIKVWDLESHKLIQKLVGHVGGVYGTSFSPDGKFLASAGMDQTVRVWDLETGKEVHQMKPHDVIVSDVKFSPDGKTLASASWDKTIKLWNTETWELIHTLEGHTNMIKTIDFSPNGKYLASGAGNNAVWETDNSVKIWNVAEGKLHCSFNNHIGMINKVIFDKNDELVYSCADDGLIKVWSYKECKEVATMVSVGLDDYVIVTPDNYYMASKNALEAVSFRVAQNLYPFEQFDLKLNRPDIVASRLGKTRQGLINAYAYLYKKRLRKMGFTEEMLGNDFHIPTLEIITEDIPITTTNGDLKFDVKAFDDQYKLDRINVYVNDVPVYGLNGIDVKKHDIKSIQQEVKLTLIPGMNKIQVSALNEKGAESLRKTFSIVYEAELKKGDLYMITIGVSEYKDNRFNLKYPSKDARDISTTIQQSKELYNNIYLKELKDSEVTIENITQLKEFLKSARPNDGVIIFIAGHGVLDANLDYYYATYDIDFDNPGERGLPYEELEKLLSEVKAFRKLLIMDTCHSGELDKEEVEKSNEVEVEVGDVGFRAAGQGIREKEGFGVENTVELMESLFSDVRKGTGATVISGAGGAEFAMESDEWNNGLFTYCLLYGLTSGEADLNHDNKIHVSEIRKYVYDKVNTVSGGRQRPTAHSENISLDYRIW